METTNLRPQTEAELIGQVVAWHNRNPLARRITRSQVTGIGVVALPFAPQTADHKRVIALFNEDFIPALKPAAIARLAWQQGGTERPGDASWPERRIAVEAYKPHVTPEIRFLLSAAIEAGNRRVRVLIGNGAQARIIGPRLWCRRRLAGAAAVAAIFVGGFAATPLWTGADQAGAEAVAAAAAAPTDARLEANQAAAPADPASAAATLAAAPNDTAADEAAGTAAHSGDEPPAVALAEPEAGRAQVTDPIPGGAESARQGSRVGDAGDAAEPARVEPSAAEPMPPARQPAVLATPHPADGDEVYALATASTSSRMASELRLGFLGVPVEPKADRPHAELMQVGSRWRVVIWPFANHADAESLRRTLASRGVNTEVIGF